MTKFVPHTEPDFDTTADGLSVAFRDRGGQHHALVTAQTNPITGGSRLHVGNRSAGIVSSASRLATEIKPVGPAYLSSSAITRHAVYLLPGMQWDAYRVRVHSIHTSAVTYPEGVAVVTQAALGDGVYGSATWDRPKFGGATSCTVPAATGTTPDHVSGTVDSDVVFSPSVVGDCNGVPGVIVAARMHGVTNHTRLKPISVPTGSLALTPSRGFLFAYKSSNAVTDPSVFSALGADQTGANGQVTDAGPALSIIAYARKDIRRIGLFGSSTISGQGDADMGGWAWRTERLMNAGTGTIYQFQNQSMPGSKTSTNLARLEKFLAMGVYDAAVYNAFSTNDSTDADYGSDAYLNRIKGQIIYYIDLCERYGVAPVIATFQSLTGMSGTQYAHCLAANAFARELAANGACAVFDVAGLLSDETAAVGTWRNAALTSDGTHPNVAGHVALATLATAAFASV